MIKSKYKHNKLGSFMFNLCGRFSEFLVKHRWLYIILAHTWGLLMTLIGYIISLALLFVGKPHKYYWVYCYSLGESWGGFEMGTMFVRDTTSTNELSQHEFGHTFQNCLLGPLYPILVGIPSMCRYWYRHISEKHGKIHKPYDAIWFEDSATEIGKYVTKALDIKH
jgi:hypothetical protein